MNEQKDTQPLLPRRDFLKLAGAGFASLVLLGLPVDLAPFPGIETEVEKEFGIDIVNPEEKDNLPRDVKHLVNTGSLEILRWTESELAVLSQILKKLPRKMYSPEPTYTGRLQFILTHHPYTDRGWIVGGGCDCKASHGVVTLEKTPGSTPSQSSFIESQSRVTHELAHKVVRAKSGREEEFFAALGIRVSDFMDYLAMMRALKIKQEH